MRIQKNHYIRILVIAWQNGSLLGHTIEQYIQDWFYIDQLHVSERFCAQSVSKMI